MNYTKAVQKYIKKYRKIINPPYSRKDYGVLAITFLILLALPVVVLVSRNRTQLNNYAATLPPVPSVAVQHYMLHGKEFFPPFAATDPSLVARGAKGSPNEKHGTGLLLPTQLGSASGGGGSTKGGKKPTPTPTVPFATATPGPLTPTSTQSSPTPTLSNLPASVDLSQYAVPVGNQGGVGSCTAWATDYNQFGWYANRDGYLPAGGNSANGSGSFAPMYTYSQAHAVGTNGQEIGSTPDAQYAILQSQGVDTRADYYQGDDDWQDLPTSSEVANAGHYKISNYTELFNAGGNHQQVIEAALASGKPVVVGFVVYQNFYNATPTNYYIDVPPAGSTSYGAHAVLAVKYDPNGLWIENQWGTYWGLNGYAELSWNFVNSSNFYIAETMTPITSVVTFTPTPSPTPMPVGDLPQPLQGHSSVIANGYVYVIGGANDNNTNHNLFSVSSVYYASVNSDGTLGSWNATTSLPQPLAHHSSVIANGYVYVIAGAVGGYEQATVYFAKLNSDGTLGPWNITTSLPQAMEYQSSVINNGYVYVIGGYYGYYLSSVYYAKLNSDGTLGSWNTATSLPQTLYTSASVTNNGFIYTVGQAGSSLSSTVFFAKPNSDGSLGNWDTTTSQSQNPQYAQNVATNNGYFYAIGGNLTTANISQFMSDGTLSNWSATTDLPQALNNSSIVTANNYVYVLGGANSSLIPQTTVYRAPISSDGTLGAWSTPQ